MKDIRKVLQNEKKILYSCETKTFKDIRYGST